MRQTISVYWRRTVRLLEARSSEERAERAACLIALLLVAAAAALKHVTGLTVSGAPFTLFGLAVAAAAARGGFVPAVVAALASLLASGLETGPAAGVGAKLLFLAESLSVAAIVCALRTRVERGAARAREADATIQDLQRRDGHWRLVDAAFRHLEEAAGDTALVVLDANAAVAEWRAGAARLYGYRADQVVGQSAGVLFADAPSPRDVGALLQRSLETGSYRRRDVHRRGDGSRIDVEIEIRPLREPGPHRFSLTVHDVARDREWDEYRQAAARAQAALQRSAEEAREQLAALESLTDPSLNPLGGIGMVAELLERLRTTTRADGVALLPPGRMAAVVAGHGLRPAGRAIAPEGLRLTPGRVEIVQNDPLRVEQLSGFRWPGRIASLLAVPVVHDGQAWSAIEVVSERARRVSDWDVALARIVADRLAPFVVLEGGAAAKAS